MPPPPSRMTKNQARNIRYRPGKALAEQALDSESEGEEAIRENDEVAHRPSIKPATAARRKLPPSRSAQPREEPDLDLEGFVTASDSSDDDAPATSKNGAATTSGDEGEESSETEDDSSSEEASSSEEEQKPRLVAPKFVSKAQRARLQSTQDRNEEEREAEEERKREEKAKELLQAQIEKEKVLRLASQKAWDEDDVAEEDDVDDTDGVDPEAEHAAWKLRELKRIKRDRLALIEKEKEREEVERRKNLTAEEREAEDREYLQKQREEQEGRGKMAYMQKYFHKGAFFQGDDQDEDVKAALSRDIAGARFVDDTNKDTLPEYMKIRDMTMLGRKGRSRYKDLKSEDTGRFGDFSDRKQSYNDLDERFRPERDDLRDEQKTGANAISVGARRRREDDNDSRHDEKRSRYQ